MAVADMITGAGAAIGDTMIATTTMTAGMAGAAITTGMTTAVVITRTATTTITADMAVEDGKITIRTI